MKPNQTPKDRCDDCKKEVLLEDLVQVKGEVTKYKVVCEDCFNKKNYEFVGRFKSYERYERR